ncbi:hypothetical protein DFH08DRAFT_819769 [Mycena albidolilacea]|uniref:Uncharacterized protein n=1 Tax=Mycena albidolilacea TaxID=1033008 RepID=A0AAD6ZDX2_9AGAR|nr:hypothetical protein DFH08DRAFT_819769 [Mycena albidolilacea]
MDVWIANRATIRATGWVGSTVGSTPKGTPPNLVGKWVGGQSRMSYPTIPEQHAVARQTERELFEAAAGGISKTGRVSDPELLVLNFNLTIALTIVMLNFGTNARSLARNSRDAEYIRICSPRTTPVPCPSALSSRAMSQAKNPRTYANNELGCPQPDHYISWFSTWF